jgi:hypothetical protein
MDKVQKSSNSECYIPSLEPFRFYSRNLCGWGRLWKTKRNLSHVGLQSGQDFSLAPPPCEPRASWPTCWVNLRLDYEAVVSTAGVTLQWVNSAELRNSWEASQYIPHLLWYPQLHYSVDKTARFSPSTFRLINFTPSQPGASSSIWI